MKKINFADAAMSICICANMWADSKFYKRRLQGGRVEVVALRATRHSGYGWTLAVMDFSQGKKDNFYGYDEIITDNAHLSDVLKEIGLI